MKSTNNPEAFEEMDNFTQNPDLIRLTTNVSHLAENVDRIAIKMDTLAGEIVKLATECTKVAMVSSESLKNLEDIRSRMSRVEDVVAEQKIKLVELTGREDKYNEISKEQQIINQRWTNNLISLGYIILGSVISYFATRLRLK